MNNRERRSTVSQIVKQIWPTECDILGTQGLDDCLDVALGKDIKFVGTEKGSRIDFTDILQWGAAIVTYASFALQLYDRSRDSRELDKEILSVDQSLKSLPEQDRMRVLNEVQSKSSLKEGQSALTETPGGSDTEQRS